MYLSDHVVNNTITFDNLTQRLAYLVDNEYYEADLLAKYTPEFLAEIHDYAASFNFEFESFLGAFKFYTSYALKTFDGKKYLENFEQRTVMVALLLAEANPARAKTLVAEIITGRFQPASYFALKIIWNQLLEPLTHPFSYQSVAAVLPFH
jgi:ribonucleoside-diphosphate reductase alpha chain